MRTPTPAAPPKPAVACLGLGALGAPMALNLLRAGYPLTVHNRSPGRQEPLLTAGAQASPTVERLIRQAGKAAA